MNVGKTLRCCVFGAGGVGGHMAVRLSSAGLPVGVIARGPHLEAIQRRGLRLLLEKEDFLHASVRATSEPSELGPQDILVVAVKLRSLAEVLEAAQPLIHRQTKVVFAMNGLPWWFLEGLPVESSAALRRLVDPSGRLGELVNTDQWVACVVNSANRVVAPGIIQSESDGLDKLVLGFAHGRSDDTLDAFVRYATAGGYQASVTSDVRRAIWQKLLINAAVAAVSTVADCTTLEACMHEASRGLIVAVMHEIVAVGRAFGIDLDVEPEEVAHPDRMPNHMTSFLQDRRAGRPLEISNGILAVQELANIVGVPAPRLDSLARVMHLISAQAGG